MFERSIPITFPNELKPMLAVVIDTEEGFDWTAGVSRSSTAVTGVRRIDKLQAVFDEYGVRPTYVIDYPIASKADGREALQPILDDGKALIGAHLHPWVNPPHREKVNQFNSYQGNLSADLEREKLRILKSTIEENFQVSPVIHKAGRYGMGPNTPEILQDLDFEIDVSAVPGYDWGADGGPDYRRLKQHLFWFGPDRKLLGIPNSGGYIGSLKAHGPTVHAAYRETSTMWKLFARALSRTRLLERIMLSPEGHSLAKMQRLSNQLVGWGYRVLALSLHSPTLQPGGTPYSSSEHDVRGYLDKCRRYFDYFFDELGGQPMTPIEIKSLALAHSAARE